MISNINIEKFSFLVLFLTLIYGQGRASDNETFFHPIGSHSLSPSRPYLSYCSRTETQPTDLSLSPQRATKSNEKFNFTSKGVFVASSQVSQQDFEDLIEPLLKKSDTQYVVIDNRQGYNPKGDKMIRSNIRLVKPWHRKALETSYLTKKQIYKLVFLPEKKVLDGLMNESSFWPEDWLFSMQSYYDDVYQA